MREIKFRAWDTKLEFMLYGEDIEKDPNYHTGLSYGKLFVAYQYKGSDWDELELMQYTGLKSKSGQEIYEGDIIQQGDKNAKCGWFAPRLVEFKDGAWMGGKIRIFVEQDWIDYQGKVSNKEWEVIGNIYENPQLLKEKEKKDA